MFPMILQNYPWLQVGFVISFIVFGCDDAIYNSSPVRELSLLTQFSGFTALQSLVLEKQCKGPRSSLAICNTCVRLQSKVISSGT